MVQIINIFDTHLYDLLPPGRENKFLILKVTTSKDPQVVGRPVPDSKAVKLWLGPLDGTLPSSFSFHTVCGAWKVSPLPDDRVRKTFSYRLALRQDFQGSFLKNKRNQHQYNQPCFEDVASSIRDPETCIQPSFITIWFQMPWKFPRKMRTRIYTHTKIARNFDLFKEPPNHATGFSDVYGSQVKASWWQWKYLRDQSFYHVCPPEYPACKGTEISLSMCCTDGKTWQNAESQILSSTPTSYTAREIQFKLDLNRPFYRKYGQRVKTKAINAPNLLPQ